MNLYDILNVISPSYKVAVSREFKLLMTIPEHRENFPQAFIDFLKQTEVMEIGYDDCMDYITIDIK